MNKILLLVILGLIILNSFAQNAVVSGQVFEAIYHDYYETQVLNIRVRVNF